MIKKPIKGNSKIGMGLGVTFEIQKRVRRGEGEVRDSFPLKKSKPFRVNNELIIVAVGAGIPATSASSNGRGQKLGRVGGN